MEDDVHQALDAQDANRVLTEEADGQRDTSSNEVEAKRTVFTDFAAI